MNQKTMEEVLNKYKEIDEKVYWRCIKRIKRAIKNEIAKAEGWDVFDASTALAICFRVPKEKTIDDLMNFEL